LRRIDSRVDLEQKRNETEVTTTMIRQGKGVLRDDGNGGDLSPDDEAFELVACFGEDEALDVCREELEKATGVETKTHWIMVKALIEGQPPDEEDDRQLPLFE
jgi:hypothetical protein